MGSKTELDIARKVAHAVAAEYRADPSTLFWADHEHEDLSPGSASVAWEGSMSDWAIEWPETASARELSRQLGVWFEPINGCILAIYAH